ITYGGDAMNAAIKNMVDIKYGFKISEQDSKKLKEEIGSADIKKAKSLGSITVKGIDKSTGLPAMVDIQAEDVSTALKGPIDRIIEAIQTTLEDTLPELVSDIVDRGIVLTGGGAKIKNLDSYLADVLRVPVFVAKDPQHAVIKGLGEILKFNDLK
ncbi:MAG: rod shape-determining protein, partial [Lactobacillaceae bacterium]|nr:rod shape-determining protein [Lactobacillaceae bacterium]